MELLYTFGANQSGGVSFTIDEIDDLQAQAREEAIQDAQDKAKKLAAQLGLSLGEIRGFNEGYAGSPPMPYYDRAVMMNDAGESKAMAPEIPAGQQEVTANVSITYEVY